MSTFSRRQFLAAAALLGASAACGGCAPGARVSPGASGAISIPRASPRAIPAADSVILWTRRPFASETVRPASPSRSPRTRPSAASSRPRPPPSRPPRTGPAGCSSAGCGPARVYWYRFTDAEGNGSRIGRTITAPADDDPRPVSFAFVSCQNINEGFQHAYRRMIYEDERAPARRAARLRPPPRRLHLRGRAISRGGRRPATTAASSRSSALPSGQQGRQFPHPAGRWPAIAPSTAPISTIPTSRTPARAGRSWRSGTITNSPGRAGRAC